MLQPALLSQSAASTGPALLGSDDARTTALNAAKAMARMVGSLDDKSVGDEALAKIQRAVSKLITPGTEASPFDFHF